ncbi:HAMP domain-containing histidine kinase [Patescibacteria group bacterium]|nr:HAMP domain-containing histidine kinase [Patescibacteria group bacterium]
MKLKLPKDILIIHIVRIALLLIFIPIFLSYTHNIIIGSIINLIILSIIFNELIKISGTILIYKYNKDKIIIGSILSIIEGFIILFIIYNSQMLLNGGYILILLSLFFNSLMYDYESVLIEGIVIGISYFFLNLSVYFVSNFNYYAIRSVIIIFVGILNYLITKKIFKIQDTVTSQIDVMQSKDVEDLKNAFTAIASHNLRTPLATIRGYFQLMETESDIGVQHKYLDLIKTNIDILSNITEEILGILTIGEEKEKTTIHPKQIIKDIIDSFKEKTTAKKIDIQIIEHSQIPDIEANQYRFRLIIENIVDNAIKYSKNNSSIEIHLSSDINNLEIRIKDYGIGIAKDKLKNIFDQYIKAGDPLVSNFEGIGLGLYMVKTIINLETGSIDIKSEENKGTEVIIKFPIQNVISSLESL